MSAQQQRLMFEGTGFLGTLLFGIIQISSLLWITPCIVLKPQTRPFSPLDPSTRRLIIVNSHGSHMKAQCIVYCMQHAINLAILPSPHITQPLDIGIFSPMKQSMSRQVVAAARVHDEHLTKAAWAAHLPIAWKCHKTSHQRHKSPQIYTMPHETCQRSPKPSHSTIGMYQQCRKPNKTSTQMTVDVP